MNGKILERYNRYIIVLAIVNGILWTSYYINEKEWKFNWEIACISSNQRNVSQEILQKEEDVYSEEEYELLAKLVEAEAGGEDELGKLLVCNVVLNRVESDKFPYTISSVINQTVGGVHQFSPIGERDFDEIVPSEESKEAVERGLNGENYAQGAVYFVARDYADIQDIEWFDRTLTYLYTHGGHEFFR